MTLNPSFDNEQKPSLNKHLGRFTISRDLIEYHFYDVLKMFNDLQIIVVRAEMNWSGQIEYIGISPFFKEVEPNVVPDNYIIEVNTGDGETSYKLR